MSIVFLLIGLLASLAGLATIGFAVPIDESSFGNTLILTGTVALSAGLILIGLGAGLRRLDRIAEALTARPIPRALRPAEPEAAAGPARASPGRAPFAPKSVESEPARRVPPEPRFVPADQGTPAEVEEADAPLSPQGPRGSAENRSPRLDPPWRPIGPTEMSTDWPAKNQMFDSLWPKGSRKAKPSDSNSTNPEPSSGPAVPGGEKRNGQAAEERQAASILKSGVVDGMAYTLYADGSIEAQLPEGILRFASIDELREHLEKHS
jgi:hypothetical protein